MNWLITGGCGFIGTNLVERILKDDPASYIRIVDNLQSGSRGMLSNVCDYTELNYPVFTKRGEVHLFVNDIKNAFSAMNLCKGIDIIVHLAANTGVPVSVQYPVEDLYTNVLGTLNYLEAARHNGVKKFLFASTSAASGGYAPPFHEKLFPRPISPYGASKGTGELYCHVYNAAYGVSTIAMRFSNVYGPCSINKEAQLIPNFVLGALRGETVKVFGDGSQTRDYCYVDDLMDAIMKALKKPINIVGGQVFQIATNVETSVQEVVDTMTEILNEHNYELDIEYTNERSGDLQRNYSDISKAKKILGWKPKTTASEGIKKTIEWFLEEKKNEKI